MKNSILIYISIIGFISSSMFGQEKAVLSGDKKYEQYSYIDAIKTYERVAEKGYKSVELFKKLGNAYYFNSEFEKAEKWYTELFAMKPEDLEPVYFYRYAQSLKAVGKTDKANKMLDLFSQKSGNDKRANLYNSNKNYLEKIKSNSNRYTEIENAGINSEYSDYGSSFYLNKLVFCSARDTGNFSQRKHAWTDKYFTNLYSSEFGDEMSLGKVEKFSKTINSKFNESTPVFTRDGKTMYFTRNNYLENKRGKDENNTTLIKIYKATFENKIWTNIVELPFNSDNYSTAHPALSIDEQTLYFASDMPGTFGQSDIFRVKILGNNSYSKPENLGPSINTEGKETFPFISEDNELFFASDGYPGLGGLDIFSAKIKSDGTFDKVVNVGEGVNSPKDDFAFLIDTKSRKGFFTSNRNGGKGSDDIYRFHEIIIPKCEQVVYGKITDIETKEALPESKVMIFDNDFKQVGDTITDNEGNYAFIVDCDQLYNVRAQKTDYVTKEESVKTDKENGKTKLDIALESSTCKVTVGDDLGKCFGIKNIYFDLNKSDIKLVAAIDLEKILDVMNMNPTMKIDIRSHTDSRASFKYNEALSERRAKSTMDWLIKNGINPNRLSGKGYGESELINGCSDGVQCTEAEHQMNRRSEFIVKEL